MKSIYEAYYGNWIIDFHIEHHICTEHDVMRKDGASWAVDLPADVHSAESWRVLVLHDVEKMSHTGQGFKFSFIFERQLLSEGFTVSWDSGKKYVEYKDRDGKSRLQGWQDWHCFGMDQGGVRVRITSVRCRH